MPITRTRSKYYVLSFLGALLVVVGVLAVPPSAQAQETFDVLCTVVGVEPPFPTTCEGKSPPFSGADFFCSPPVGTMVGDQSTCQQQTGVIPFGPMYACTIVAISPFGPTI